MPTNKKVSGDVRRQIVELFLEMRRDDPGTNAAMVAEAIRTKLQKRNTRLLRDNPNWPSDSTVRKILVPVRGQVADPDDRPWSLAELPSVDIPPEALPSIVRIWGFIEAADPALVPLTIRQAKWIARLLALFTDEWNLLVAATYMAIQEQVALALHEVPRDTKDRSLWDWMMDYAALIGVEPDDSVVDKVKSRIPSELSKQASDDERRLGSLTEPQSRAWSTRLSSGEFMTVLIQAQYIERAKRATEREERRNARPYDSTLDDTQGVANEGTHPEAACFEQKGGSRKR